MGIRYWWWLNRTGSARLEKALEKGPKSKRRVCGLSLLLLGYEYLLSTPMPKPKPMAKAHKYLLIKTPSHRANILLFNLFLKPEIAWLSYLGHSLFPVKAISNVYRRRDLWKLNSWGNKQRMGILLCPKKKKKKKHHQGIKGDWWRIGVGVNGEEKGCNCTLQQCDRGGGTIWYMWGGVHMYRANQSKKPSQFLVYFY